MLLLSPLLSGFAALIWQVLWVRELGLVSGSTVVAMALTTGVFLLGTGVGARIAGRWSDRINGLHLYAVCEVGIAAWGVVSWPVLVRLASTGIAAPTLAPTGWWEPGAVARVSQLALAVASMGAPTLAMGASLPLLASSYRSGAAVGRRLATLAAMNTLGAAVGAFSTDFLILPSMGLAKAGWTAAGAGLVAAAVAAVYARRDPVGAAGEVRTASAAIPPTAHASTPSHIALAAALAGFAAMGIEVLWFRFLGSALGPYRAVYSLLLTVLLTGWALGAAVGGRLATHVAPARLYAWAQNGVALTTIVGLWAHDNEALVLRQVAAADRFVLHGVNVLTVAIVVLPASMAMGLGFSALAALSGERPSQAAARLWFAITAGNAAGAVVTGLVLLPALGMTRLAALLAAVAALAPLALGIRHAPPYIVAISVVFAATLLPSDHLVWSSFPYGRAQEEGVLAVAERLDETLVVTGDPAGPARLWTNGHPMSATTARGQRYMRLLAHVPLLGNPGATDALVICFGVGNTLHAASLHPLKRITLADISRGVLEQAPWFEHANHGVLRDPRVQVHVDDGRHLLRGFGSRSLDLITLEPPPMAHAGVATLYSQEFYALAHDRLRVGGWITQWLPAYQVPDTTVRALVGAFVEEFPDAVLLVGADRELILAGVRDGVPAVHADTFWQRSAALPLLAADLDAIGIRAPEDLAALFAADGARLRAVAGPPMTDDAPILEWSQTSHVTRTRLPEGLLDPAGWERFVPGAVLAPARMAESRALWSSEAFRSYSNVPREAAR